MVPRQAGIGTRHLISTPFAANPCDITHNRPFRCCCCLLVRWFGVKATGITLSAFGLGAAIAPVIIDYMTAFYFVAPEFAGPFFLPSCTATYNTAFLQLRVLI